jgi:hypothetical protein
MPKYNACATPSNNGASPFNPPLLASGSANSYDISFVLQIIDDALSILDDDEDIFDVPSQANTYNGKKQ